MFSASRDLSGTNAQGPGNLVRHYPAMVIRSRRYFLRTGAIARLSRREESVEPSPIRRHGPSAFAMAWPILLRIRLAAWRDGCEQRPPHILRHVYFVSNKPYTGLLPTPRSARIFESSIAHNDGNYTCDEAKRIADLGKFARSFSATRRRTDRMTPPGNPNGSITHRRPFSIANAPFRPDARFPQRAVEIRPQSVSSAAWQTSIVVEALVGAARAPCLTVQL